MQIIKKLCERKKKLWCESENIWLRIMFPYVPTKILAERFHTSYSSVDRQAGRLGLKKDKEARGEAISEGKKAYYRSIEHPPYFINDVKMIYVPDHPRANNQGRKAEHTLIMEKKLGRYLEEWERVLHKDNDNKNINPNNLYLLTCTTVKSVNSEEIVEKRKSGTSIKKLIEEYNINSNILYKILTAGGCVNKYKK